MVVLQPYVGVGFAIVLNDVAQWLETLWKTCITHIASERLWPQSFRAEDASLMVINSSVAWVPYAVLGLCIFIPLAVLTTCLEDSTGRGPRSALVRKPFLSKGAPGWPFAARPWRGQGMRWRPQLNAVWNSLPAVRQRSQGCPLVVDTSCLPHRRMALAKCLGARPPLPRFDWPR
jgi:hypothetical protein